MARDNIANHSMRLNLNNEQHLRVHDVLKDLNTGIHKSVNQFMINAVDFYIQSFEEDSLTNKEARNKQEGQEIIKRSDIADIKKEIQNEVKDEIIRILAGGKFINYPEIKREESFGEESGNDSIMADLANKWG